MVSAVLLLIAGSAAHAAIPPVDWGQDGYGPGNTRYNPVESVVNADSINRLKLRWTANPAPGDPGCRPAPAGPLVVGNRVFLLDGGGVGAYDATTGRRLWLRGGLGLVTAGPIVTGGLVLVFSTSCYSNSDYAGTVTALDAATGAPKWHATGDWTIDTAVADAGTVVASGHCETCSPDRHGVTAYRLTDGKAVWKHANRVLAGPVTAGGTVLLRPTQGGDTWASMISSGVPVWGSSQIASAVAADPSGTRFYLEDGAGLCLRAAGEGKQLWQVPKEAGDLATDGRRVYVASAGRVNTYDAATGRSLWSRALANPRTPVRAGGLLYVVYGAGRLAILSPADGKPVSMPATYAGLTRHVVPAGGRLLTVQGTTVRAYAP